MTYAEDYNKGLYGGVPESLSSPGYMRGVEEREARDAAWRSSFKARQESTRTFHRISATEEKIIHIALALAYWAIACLVVAIAVYGALFAISLWLTPSRMEVSARTHEAILLLTSSIAGLVIGSLHFRNVIRKHV